MIKLNDLVVTPTIFPDKTSQMWQIDEEYILDRNIIEWEFESEAELFHICQLADILNDRDFTITTLVIKYLPYGRQDKPIDNEQTFALHTFARIINSCQFVGVSILDAHSLEAERLIKNCLNVFPQDHIQAAIDAVPNCVLAYPDKGAFDRYSVQFGADAIIGDKVRDPSTGYITHYEVTGDPQDKDILIVDDICDGGMTFKILAKSLLDQGAKSVHLYVTHGIFSKGIKTLKDSGVSRIFTHKGEIGGVKIGDKVKLTGCPFDEQIPEELTKYIKLEDKEQIVTKVTKVSHGYWIRTDLCEEDIDLGWYEVMY